MTGLELSLNIPLFVKEREILPRKLAVIILPQYGRMIQKKAVPTK